MSDAKSFEEAFDKLLRGIKATDKSFEINPLVMGTLYLELAEVKVAHEHECESNIDQLRAEYHRGYTDAMHARATETWQLDRERMDVVRRLRKFRADEDTPWVRDFWEAVTGEKLPAYPAKSDLQLTHIMRDRLIHLLGGDQPRGIDVLRAMDAESDKDGTCPNDVPTSSITDGNAESTANLPESAEFNKLDGRRATISKLERLQFDGGSHENLSKIAYAIYPCATGWTCESAKGLRDSLVRLIGGDDGGRGVSGDVCRRACADGGAGDSGELAEVELLKVERERDHWKQVATDTMNHADDIERERDELKEHCRNQQKQLAEFNRVLNTWHWDAENYKQWCPMSLDREVRKATEKWLNERARSAELKAECGKYKAECNRLKDARYDLTMQVAALTEEYDMYLDLLKDASEEYKLVAALCDELEEQRDKLTQLVANMRMERNELQKRLSELETFDPE